MLECVRSTVQPAIFFAFLRSLGQRSEGYSPSLGRDMIKQSSCVITRSVAELEPEVEDDSSSGRYYLLLTTYQSLLTTYYLLLTTYYLPLTTYYLPLTTYDLLITTYYLLPATYYLLLITHHLLLAA